MTNSQITQAYLADLALTSNTLDVDFIKRLQSRHVAQYSFNSLAVVLGQEMPLDLPSLFNKIVTKGRGGYCFEHNKLVFTVLGELGFEARLLLAKVVNKQGADVARTHRITLLSHQGEQYIVDAGFGHLGARYPVKLVLGLAQDQGDCCYRIIQNSRADYCYQVLKQGEFITLYTFDLHYYSEADCALSHFFSHQHPSAVFVNNLVICRKHFNDVKSLRNGEFHHIENGATTTTQITQVKGLHQLLTQVFELDLDIAISEFLFHKFVDKQLT
jgi:N-hydroxyarylamine O-acetyltransferase